MSDDTTSTPAANAPTSLAQLMQVAHAQAPQTYGPGIERTTIDDPTVTANEFDAFKVSKNKKERITVLDPNGVFVGRTHYVEKGADGVPYGYFLCRSEYKRQGTGEDQREVAVHTADCCRKLGSPRKRCVALIIKHGTDKDGRLVHPYSHAMQVWRFSEKIFGQLRTANAEFPLTQHDLLVTLDGDEKFQGVQLQSLKDSVMSVPAVLQQYGPTIQAWVVSMQPKMEQAIGRRLNDAEWAKVLGAPAATATTVVDEPVQSLESLLST